MARHGYSQTVMGQVLGKKQNTVSALLALTRLPGRIRDEFPSATRVTKSLLIEIAQIQEPALQLRLWEDAKRGTATVRAARAARASSETPARATPTRMPGRVIAAGERFMRDLKAVPEETLAGSPALLARVATLHRELGELLQTAKRSPG